MCVVCVCGGGVGAVVWGWVCGEMVEGCGEDVCVECVVGCSGWAGMAADCDG